MRDKSWCQYSQTLTHLCQRDCESQAGRLPRTAQPTDETLDGVRHVRVVIPGELGVELRVLG